MFHPRKDLTCVDIFKINNGKMYMLVKKWSFNFCQLKLMHYLLSFLSYALPSLCYNKMSYDTRNNYITENTVNVQH